jgi:very-short-patch-repair endonuclease
MLECSICNNTFESKIGLTEHITKKHILQRFEQRKCLGCGVTFTAERRSKKKYHSIACFNSSPFKKEQARKNLNNPPWSRGLTKETDARILRQSIKSSISLKGNPKCTGKASTPEKELLRRQRLSENKIQYLLNNPDKVPYLLNHSSKESFPERYFRQILYTLPGIEFKYRVSLYCLDIAFPIVKLNIEIDGEQHYTDKNVIASNERRNKYLKKHGWKCIRIRWSQYQKLDIDKRRRFITDLKENIINTGHMSID